METHALIEHFKSRGRNDEEITEILRDVKELEDFIHNHNI